MAWAALTGRSSTPGQPPAGVRSVVSSDLMEDRARLLRAASEAQARGRDIERQLLDRYPRAWDQMDAMRDDPPMDWPEWCLLPMAAAVAIATSGASGPLPAGRNLPIAHLAALYAWRFARSVYVVEPGLMSRLLGQVPDAVSGPGAFTGLPEWCVYIAAADPEWPGAGLWAHLESDANTGRPELRLLLDPTGTGDVMDLVPVPVYLDRPTLTEGLADFRATAAASVHAGQVRTGADVRGAQPDAATVSLADRVDQYLSLLLYLARPEADITNALRPSVRPVKPWRPMRETPVWLVGYADR